MAYIDYQSPESVPSKYRVDDQDNIIQIHAIHPAVMKLHHELYLELMHRKSPWTRIQREQVAIVVSALNLCVYWVEHHTRGLQKLLASQGWDELKSTELIKALSEDYRQAELEPVDRAILNYALKLTVEPSSVSIRDVNAIRAYGYDDLAIHDLCAIISYFAFVNRIADGLGVELESLDN